MPQELPSQKPNDSPPKKKSNKLWLILIIIILFIAAAVVAFFVLSDTDSEFSKDTETKSMESEEVATPSAEPKEEAYECNGQVYENKKQGYKVCIKVGWVKKEFDSAATTVGFDPDNIPEASEYFGLITVSVSGSDLDTVISEVESSLSSTSTTTTEVDGVSATQVSGTEPDSLVAMGGPVTKTFFTHFSRLYVVTLGADTVESQQFYEDFLESWKFLDAATEPPPVD